MDIEPALPRSDATEPILLADRLMEVPDWLSREPKAAFDHFHTGAFVLQSLPAAFYCFLRSPDDSRQAILTAANCGHDTDTVASMAGNLVGTWVGAERRVRHKLGWAEDLEVRDELLSLADRLRSLRR